MKHLTCCKILIKRIERDQIKFTTVIMSLDDWNNRNNINEWEMRSFKFYGWID